MAFCELQSLVRKKLGRRHQINVPEDLPLLLPQYPVLFEDYVEGNRELETIALEWEAGSSHAPVPAAPVNAYPSPYSNIHTLIHFNDGYQIFVSGFYDIIHAGHIQFFREARSLGDFLIVSFASEQVLWKSKRRKPIHPGRP